LREIRRPGRLLLSSSEIRVSLPSFFKRFDLRGGEGKPQVFIEREILVTLQEFNFSRRITTTSYKSFESW
jgi:hypothetical protein